MPHVIPHDAVRFLEVEALGEIWPPGGVEINVSFCHLLLPFSAGPTVNINWAELFFISRQVRVINPAFEMQTFLKYHYGVVPFG